MSPSAPYTRLLGQLTPLGRVAVAFSGGVDSTLLLHAAVEALGAENVLALTAASRVLPRQELEDSRAFTASRGLRHAFVDIDPLAREEVRANDPRRCYFCKQLIFSQLLQHAKTAGFDGLIDGTNVDDALDYRPGTQAARELGVRSPLEEAGLGKADIRALGRLAGLPGWDKPPLTCYLTRFPYGTTITPKRLEQVRRCEEFLASRGFSGFRVRYHDQVARLEISPDHFQRLLDPALRHEVVATCRQAGFTYVALDLEGYRQGSLNPAGLSANL